jgi:hypothetical protein
MKSMQVPADEERADLVLPQQILPHKVGWVNRVNDWAESPPWQPETLRWLATALLFPLGMWLIQLILSRLYVNRGVEVILMK